MSKHKALLIVEILGVIGCVVSGFLWLIRQDGYFEPYTYVFGLVAVGVDFARRIQANLVWVEQRWQSELSVLAFDSFPSQTWVRIEGNEKLPIVIEDIEVSTWNSGPEEPQHAANHIAVQIESHDGNPILAGTYLSEFEKLPNGSIEPFRHGFGGTGWKASCNPKADGVAPVLIRVKNHSDNIVWVAIHIRFKVKVKAGTKLSNDGVSNFEFFRPTGDELRKAGWHP